MVKAALRTLAHLELHSPDNCVGPAGAPLDGAPVALLGYAAPMGIGRPTHRAHRALIILLLAAAAGTGCSGKAGSGGAGGSVPGDAVQIEGVIAFAYDYGGPGPEGIQLTGPIGVVSTAGAQYQLAPMRDGILDGVSSDAIYALTGVPVVRVEPAGAPPPIQKVPRWFKLYAVQLKQQFTADDQQLLKAAKDNDYATAQALIAKGANVHVRSTSFETPLLAVLSWPHPDGDSDTLLDPTATARALIERGADVNASNDFGWTPLHDAASHGLTEIAEALLARGAKVRAATRDGTTPLHIAARRGAKSLPVARLLLAAGADLTGRDAEGKTPIDFADEATRRALSGMVAEPRSP